MDLDGAWEIGLAEIQYPRSWYNVKNNEAWLKVETHVEFILEVHPVLFPLERSFWLRNSTHPVTRPKPFVVLTSIKFSVRVLSLGGTENGGRCPSTVENRTGGRKRRRNNHPNV
jgi:hypothetical protein